MGGNGQVGGLGGTGYGGTAEAGNWNPNEVTERTGISDFGDVSVTAAGQGGDGGAGDEGNGGADDGDGGDGYGGYAALTVSGMTIANNVSLNATGTGGVGTNGGDGYGGSGETGGVEIYVAPDSEAIITGNIEAVAFGFGGAGLTGDGGDGFGGEGNVTVEAGGSIDGGDDGNGGRLRGGDLFVRVRGEGGTGGSNGGAGGDGFAGGAYFDLLGSAKLSNIGLRSIGVGGLGGDGANGGDGGDGDGGDVTLIISGSLDAVDFEMIARGVGGYGGYGSDGRGGDGGDGWGGDSTLTVESGATLNARIFLGSTSTDGGNGGDGVDGFGDGGSAQGGNHYITIDGDAFFVGAVDEFEGFVATSYGNGGEGATGGDGTAGSSTITVNGSLTTDGRLQASAGAEGGIGVDYGGSADGGTATLNVIGTLNSDVIHVRTSATGGSGAVEGGDADAGTSTLTIDGSVTAATIEILADGIGGTGLLEGGGLGGIVQLTIGAEFVTDLVDAELSALGVDGSVTVTGDLVATGDVEFDAGGDINFDNVTADEFSFHADGAVTGGNINANSEAGGSAVGAVVLGDITVGPGLPPIDSDGFSVAIGSATSINVGNVSATGNVGFVSLGALTTGNLSAGDLVLIMASGDIDTGSITTAADGRVYIGDGSMFALGGGGEFGLEDDVEDDFDPNIVLGMAPIATGGSILINGTVTTGLFEAAAGTDLTINDANVTNSVVLSAGGLASFLGTVSAPTITVTSSDIYVDFYGSLGVYGVTNLLTLNAVNDQGVYIGDFLSELPGGIYTLDEDGDIQAANVVINALPATVNGTAPRHPSRHGRHRRHRGLGALAVWGTASVTLNTASSILVSGAVEYYNAAATDSLTLNAGQDIIVDTDTGSIEMYATGQFEQFYPSGLLTLSAENVWVAESAIIAQLESDPNFAGRDAALAASDGLNPLGFVVAGGVTVEFGDTFLVQNSGTPSRHGRDHRWRQWPDHRHRRSKSGRHVYLRPPGHLRGPLRLLRQRLPLRQLRRLRLPRRHGRRARLRQAQAAPELPP